MAKKQGLVTKDFSHVKSVDDFAVHILAAWHKAIDSIIEVGMLCSQARNALSRKDLTDLKSKLRMSDSTFTKLIKIAEDKRITEEKNKPYLPSSYGTLYELTQLTDKQFKSAIDQGVLKPETERRTVIALRSEGAASTQKSGPAGNTARTLVRITTESGSVSKEVTKALQTALMDLMKFRSISVEVSPLYKQLISKPK